MIDKVRIDSILEVSSPIVREKNIDGLAARISLILCRTDTVIDRGDDVGMGVEERISFDFLQSEGDGFLTEGAADFL